METIRQIYRQNSPLGMSNGFYPCTDIEVYMCQGRACLLTLTGDLYRYDFTNSVNDSLERKYSFLVSSLLRTEDAVYDQPFTIIIICKFNDRIDLSPGMRSQHAAAGPILVVLIKFLRLIINLNDTQYLHVNYRLGCSLRRVSVSFQLKHRAGPLFGPFILHIGTHHTRPSSRFIIFFLLFINLFYFYGVLQGMELNLAESFCRHEDNQFILHKETAQNPASTESSMLDVTFFFNFVKELASNHCCLCSVKSYLVTFRFFFF